MRRKMGWVLAAAAVAAGGCGDDGQAVATCADRWNVRGNTIKVFFATLTANVGRKRIDVWLGPSKRDKDRCIAVVGAPGLVDVFREPAGGGKVWEVAEGELSRKAARQRLRDRNARILSDGNFVPLDD